MLRVFYLRFRVWGLGFLIEGLAGLGFRACYIRACRVLTTFQGTTRIPPKGSRRVLQGFGVSKAYLVPE